MALWPTQAKGLAKNLLHRSMTGCDLATILELEAKTQLILTNSKETREAIQAFLEKRKL